MQHSNIVGGSTAKRVIACPGSVALCAKMPAKPSSDYADEGTLLHDIIAQVLDKGVQPETFLGCEYENITLTQDLLDTKLIPALEALDAIDPNKFMDIAVETRVGFGEDILPGVFGSTDLLGRIGDRAYVIDWKFGDGVAVYAEENPQLMFYAAAAMRTPDVKWVFDGATEIECIIIQPTKGVTRWVTTPARIAAFEQELILAVKRSEKTDAPLAHGDHCKWCAARPICPIMTGAVDRAVQTQIQGVDAEMIGKYLANADLLEGWIKDLRSLATQMLEKNVAVPGYKLVPKRATRQWVNEVTAYEWLSQNFPEAEVTVTSVISPAKTDPLLKKAKLSMPEGLVVSVSSGNTLASEDDPRPAVLQIGQQMVAALSKLGV
jgi:hypothetical protein